MQFDDVEIPVLKVLYFIRIWKFDISSNFKHDFGGEQSCDGDDEPIFGFISSVKNFLASFFLQKEESLCKSLVHDIYYIFYFLKFRIQPRTLS